jgi:hypothetical protein
VDAEESVQVGELHRSSTSIDKPTRPFEFSAWVSVPFFGFFILLAVGLVVLYVKSTPNGMCPHVYPVQTTMFLG